MRRGGRRPGTLNGANKLTERELEVLQRLATGSKVAQIAAALGIDPRTVTTYQRRAGVKLGVTDLTVPNVASAARTHFYATEST